MIPKQAIDKAIEGGWGPKLDDGWKFGPNSLYEPIFDGRELSMHRIALDPMFFKGNFYRDGIERPTFVSDLNPQFDGVEEADATALSFNDESISSIILDPPFMIANRPTQREFYSSKTHTFYDSFEALEKSYKELLAEAHRILKPKGVLFFKCQDYTDTKTTMTHNWVWKWAEEQGFYTKDLAILVLPNKIYNGNTTQRHLRKIHTYFFVFVKYPLTTN